jgi:predicted phosphodiesterase
MQRRHFLETLAAGAVAGTAGTLGSASAKPTPAVPLLPGPLLKTPAVMMAPRSDGLEVVWAVGRLARGWVEWKGPDGTSGKAAETSFGFVPQGERVMRVRLDRLKPGTEYQLRAVAEAGDGTPAREEGPWRTFRTLDPKAATTQFAVWNDTHQWADTLKKLHEVTPKADFLVWNGDTCNDWAQEEWLAPTLLHPGEQDISAGRPLMVIWGNHDVRGKWAFKMPEWVATPDGRPYHAFRSGPVACICLHTGEDKPDNHPSFGGRVAFDALRREQADWLAQAIVRPEIRDAPYRVVFCHIPLRWLKESQAAYDQGGYDTYSRRSRDAWHGSLVAWRAQVVISGHTHQTASIPATSEFPYAQWVGGGPQLERATRITGTADATGLRLVMHDLAGKVVQQANFQPLA